MRCKAWLVTLLTLVAGCKKDPPRPAAADVFASVCARCHGERGTGGEPVFDGGPAPRDFTDHEFQAGVSDAEIRTTIVRGKSGAMPAFGAMFDDGQLDGLVARVRAFDAAKAARKDVEKERR